MSIIFRYGNILTPQENDLIAKSIQIYGEWAQNEIDTLNFFIREGDSILDVGAFIGTHSLAFSNLTGKNGRVYAFEPNPSSFEYLKKNTENKNNIIIENLALSDKEEYLFV